MLKRLFKIYTVLLCIIFICQPVYADNIDDLHITAGIESVLRCSESSNSLTILSHNINYQQYNSSTCMKQITRSEDVSNNLIYAGRFRITYYCSCPKCCGIWSGLNKTYSGTTPTAGRTIGVDPDIIPLGTHVMLYGHEYIAEDTGNFTGEKLDVYCDHHEDCFTQVKKYGDYGDVYIIKEDD